MDGEACYCHSNGKQCHVENLLGNYKFTIWQQCKIRIRDAESQRIIVWLNTAYNYLTVVSMIKVHDRNSIFSEEANYLTVGSLGHSPILRASVPGSDSGWRWWQDSPQKCSCRPIWSSNVRAPSRRDRGTMYSWSNPERGAIAAINHWYIDFFKSDNSLFYSICTKRHKKRGGARFLTVICLWVMMYLVYKMKIVISIVFF